MIGGMKLLAWFAAGVAATVAVIRWAVDADDSRALFDGAERRH